VLSYGVVESTRGQRRRLIGLAAVAATAALAGAFAAGSAIAFGSASASPAARSPKTGVVVVNTRLYGGGAAAGTGIVLTSSGEVVTNNHVIRGASAVRVTDTSTGRSYTATVAGYSVSKDVALLKLANASGLATVSLGNPNALSRGIRVTAVGNAGGTGVLTTKTGRLTGLHESITVSDDEGGSSRLTGVIATSAPLQPGDSGGPLLWQGRVVGIDAAATRSFSIGGSAGGYAIPIDTALAVVHQVEAGKPSSLVHVGPTAFLGVALAPNNSFGQTGALVQDVVPGSPAEKAGIGPDDVIVSFGSRTVTSANGLRSLVLTVSPGRAVRLGWVDQVNGQDSATVRLVSGPPQ